MVNSGSLLTWKMEFFVLIVISIGKSPILDVPGVSGYIIVLSAFGYSADGIPWWQEIFNLRIVSVVSVVPYTKESTWCW